MGTSLEGLILIHGYQRTPISKRMEHFCFRFLMDEEGSLFSLKSKAKNKILQYEIQRKTGLQALVKRG